MTVTFSSAHIATIYRFCAQSMQYPEPDWLTKDYLNSLYNLLAELGGKNEIADISSALDSADDFMEDLQVEYTRLFINGQPHVVAPPYGSVYVDKSLQGIFAEKVALYYQSQGYCLTKNGDLPDNLIHQLEFLSFLAEDNNSQAEKKFISQFFLPWYPTFSNLVKKETQHPFYHVIISIIDFFTQEEKEYGVQLNEA